MRISMLSADGHVSEASAANLFMVRGGRLITPAMTGAILEGITRSTFLQMAEGEGIDTVERPIDRSELYVADELFLCGTGVSIVPVAEVDHRRIAGGAPGPITTLLRDLYIRTVKGEEPKYRHWCTPVSRAAARPEVVSQP